MIDEYLDTLQEGFFFSDKTISVNLDLFEKDKTKKLLIIGNAGSGKTTLSIKLGKKYNVKSIGTDSIYKYLYDNRKHDNFKVDPQDVAKIVYYYLKQKNEKMIIEGIDIADMYTKYSNIKDIIIKTPMIILGQSAIKSGIRAGIRNAKTTKEHWKEIYWLTYINFKRVQPSLNQLRKDVNYKYKDNIINYKI